MQDTESSRRVWFGDFLPDRVKLEGIILCIINAHHRLRPAQLECLLCPPRQRDAQFVARDLLQEVPKRDQLVVRAD